MTASRRSPARPHPRSLRATCLLGVLIVAGSCSTAPRRRAADRAVKAMLTDLQSKRADFAAAAAGERDPFRVVIFPSDDVGLDVAWALNKNTSGMRILATGEDAEKQFEVLMKSAGDEFDQSDHTSGFNELGLKLKADLFISASQREVDDGEVEVMVKASQLSTGQVEGQGLGGSYGNAERARNWGVTGAKCLAVPFLVLFDIGGTSVDYAFKDEKKPGFVSTVSRSLLAIVYSPVAIFTSKYPKTRNWFSTDDEA